MNEKTAILNVRMLGDFSITYDGRQVSFGKNTTTKAMKLLQILIYYGEQGIAREKLLNALYVREELADAANNLRVTAHRLKKMIIDAGLPEYDYIVIKKGVYRWNAPVPTIVVLTVCNFPRQLHRHVLFTEKNLYRDRNWKRSWNRNRYYRCGDRKEHFY